MSGNKKTLKELSRETGLKYTTLYMRVKKLNWDKEIAKKAPVNVCGSYKELLKNIDMIQNENNLMVSRTTRGRKYYRRDITGLRSGKLLVLGYSHEDPKVESVSMWKCQCDCGNITYVRLQALTNNKIKSCGCIKNADPRVSHPLYKVWSGIKQRCNNTKCNNYKNYGGRGIFFFKEWNDDYISFYNYSIGIFKDSYQIDRIDNNKGYEPGNIRWVTNAENVRNRRVSKLTEQDVRHIRSSTMSHKMLAEKFGIALSTVRSLRSWANI